MNPRTLRMDEVDFTIECLPEQTQIEGNAIASGDEDLDNETNASIRAQLDRGNEWAWCCVRVIGRWEDLEADTYLGCCSYRSRKDFESEQYCADMKDEVLDQLNAQIVNLVTKVQEQS